MERRLNRFARHNQDAFVAALTETVPARPLNSTAIEAANRGEIGFAPWAVQTSDPMYRRWIETYGGEEYAAVVEAVLTEVDRVGEGLTPVQRAAVQEVFVTGSRYEWMFWDMGWRLEQWPV